MIQFPFLEGLSIDEFILFPGHSDNLEGPPDPATCHFKVDLDRGPWIVLGVNGLGKSTLLLLLKHLVVGAVRARDAGFSGERADFVSVDSRFFAVRASDGARTARATLQLRIGGGSFQITRRLSDLSLVEAWCGDDAEPLTTENAWRERVTTSMGLGQFEDVVRVLDRIMFCLESPSPLIWDLSAQFELFRALLTPDSSAELRRLEGEIVSNDSFARNLSATIFRLSDRRDKQLRLIETSGDTHAQIAAATARLEKGRSDEAKFQSAVEASDVRLSDAQLQLKRADRDLDTTASVYEAAKYQALRHAFAGIPPTDQYIFIKIISERLCLVCGNPAEATAKDLESRQADDRCLVCGAPRHTEADVIPTTRGLRNRTNKAFEELSAARIARETASREADSAVVARQAAVRALDDARNAVDRELATLRKLRRKLPASDRAALAREEDHIEALRKEVLRFRKLRVEAEDSIASLLEELTAAAILIRGRLEEKFQTLAKGFFAERLRLVYAPRRDRIGQGGRVFDFPAFEVEMTSGSTSAEYVRRNEDQVSLSQREYLDIIFRMSLLNALGQGSCSLVVDGPEGSLDAVFAGRAGDLFSDFSAGEGRSVILACNIVEGAFLPNTLRRYRPTGKRRHVINLIETAMPTAALRELRADYDRAVTTVLATKPRRSR